MALPRQPPPSPLGATAPAPDAGRRGLLLVLAVAVGAGLLVAAFVLPNHKPQPHDLSVGVTGGARGDAVARALEHGRPGAFAVRRYASAGDAAGAVRRRDVYGAIDPAGPTVLVASGASAQVAMLLRRTATSLPGLTRARVADLAPLSPEDPNGVALNLLALPVIVICLPASLLLASLVLPRRTLVALIALLGALVGLSAMLVARVLVDVLPGPYLALAGVGGLMVLAIACTAAGLERLLGPPGIALAGLVFFVIGNPGSGNATAPPLLPAFWRPVGPNLPGGAGGEALRSVAYFHGHGAGAEVLKLLAWLAFGLGLVALSRIPRRAGGPVT